MRYENAEGMEHPMTTTLQPGKYSWCRCGKTQTPPWCDGSHEGTGIEPLEFAVDEASEVSVCNCGLTQDPPWCDGSHDAY